MNPFKKDDAAKLTAEVDRLTRKREALSAKLVASQSAEESAREAQRKFFVETENLDASDSARLSAAVASAVSEVAAVTDAIQTVDALIAEGQTAIVSAREASARQRRASEIEAKIAKLEPMAASAESLFEKLADVLTKIVDTADCPDLQLREYRVIQGPGSNLPAATLTGAALTEAIFRSLPDGFSVTKAPTSTFAAANLPLMTRRDGGLSPDLPLDDDNGAGFRPLPLSGALTQNIITPLREAAKEILAGSRPITSTKTMIENHDEAEPVFSYPWVVFIKPARWRDWRGELIEQTDSRAMVPQPVADAALKAGVAFPENAPEAQAHEERRYQRGFHSSSVAMSKAAAVDLDVRWPATKAAA